MIYLKFNDILNAQYFVSKKYYAGDLHRRVNPSCRPSNSKSVLPVPGMSPGLQLGYNVQREIERKETGKETGQEQHEKCSNITVLANRITKENSKEMIMEIKGKYATAIIYTDNIEGTALHQIEELCDQEFAKDGKIRIMPDAHAGIGCVIGTTMTIKE